MLTNYIPNFVLVGGAQPPNVPLEPLPIQDADWPLPPPQCDRDSDEDCESCQ